MKILIDIGHPAHVHLFRHFAREMQDKKHSVLFSVRQKESNVQLLEKYGLDYIWYGQSFKSIPGKIFGLVKYDYALYKIAKSFSPDISLSHSSFYLSQVSKLLGCTNITLEDSGNLEQILLYKPFTNVILTPACYSKDHGKKQLYYDGNHELFYLHPKRFSPDDSIFSGLSVEKGTPYCIIRFSAWGASHDISKGGFTTEEKEELVRELSKRIKVYITSEANLPESLKQYQISIAPEKLHDAIAFASLVISEGATIASEAGVLGTPSIYVNPLVRSYNEELGKYGLLYNFRNGKGVLQKAVEILNTPSVKQEFQQNRKKFLNDKIDPTAFLVWFVENYPESVRIRFES